MRKNYLSFSEIINYFGRDTIMARYKFLHDKMQEYIIARNLEDKLYVNVGILHQTVMDYFSDLYRMKEFHKINKADMISILSYEIYWILRRKPIAPMPGENDSRLIFCNEGFVTTLIAHELLVPAGEAPINASEETTLLDFLREVNYHFRYRSIDKQDIELILYAYRTGGRLHFVPDEEK